MDMNEQDMSDLFTRLKAWATDDLEFSKKWRKQAREDIRFAEGPDGQWTAEDRAKLADDRRPVVTFNKTKKYIRAICGIEVNNRHETVFKPRELDNVGEVKANETLTAASEWMEHGCYAPRHQSRAFRFATTCGMGWTEASIDFDDDPAGLYAETSVHPCEMFWDREARDQNVMDAKRLGRVRQMRMSDAKNLLLSVIDPKKFSDDDFDAQWAAQLLDGSGKAVDDRETHSSAEMQDRGGSDFDKMVTLVHMQWFDFEPYYVMLDPMTGQKKEGTVEEYTELNKTQGMMHPSGKWPGVRMRRKVYKQAFLGNRLLYAGDSPCPVAFTFNAITWEPNDDGTWAGLVMDMRDPQSWTNKFFAQMMHIINSTAKGGVIAEADAFSDIEEAKQTYPRADALTIVNPGAISKGKIMAKPGGGVTAGVMQLMDLADRAFSDVSGLNLELMGLADREQAGVLEAQRKQAAMTILATLFEALSLFRERVGRVRLHYIQTVLADGRLIRIAGKDSEQAIPLIKDKVLGKYDVIVEDAPTSPNSKEKIWAALNLLLPPLMQAGMVGPEHVLVLLDYVPGLPSKLVQTFRAMANTPDPAKQEAADRATQMQEAEIADKVTSAQSKHAQAILSLAKAGAENAAQEATVFDSVLSALGFGLKPKPGALPADQVIMGQGSQAPGGPRPLPELGEGQAPQVQELNGGTPPGMQLPGGLTNGRGV